VVTQNPPLVPGILAFLYCAVLGGVFVLDSHPSAFGDRRSVSGRVFLPLHRRLVRWAELSLVPSDELAATVADWGGRPAVLYEAFSADEGRTGTQASPYVVYAGSFNDDEPIHEVVGAASISPDLEFLLLGASSSPGFAVPKNVRLAGFLSEHDYRSAVRQARAIVALTTDARAVLRTACEATLMCRPLVTSDTPPLRRAFPHALHVSNERASIADGLRLALERDDAALDQAHTELLATIDVQLAAVRKALGLPAPATPPIGVPA
jgi:hypothetical protein